MIESAYTMTPVKTIHLYRNNPSANLKYFFEKTSVTIKMLKSVVLPFEE
jgi:hypothetical protein